MAVLLRPMNELDLPAARKIYRDAFCAFAKIPEKLLGVGDYIGFRFKRDPASAVVAEQDGEVIAACLYVNRGTISLVGPVVVKPTLSRSGLGARVLAEADRSLRDRGNTLTLCYTFAYSAGHAAFFGRAGFRPRTFNPILRWQCRPPTMSPTGSPFLPFSGATAELRAQWLDGCDALTDELYPGFSVRRDLEAVQAQRLGETLIQCEGSRVEALAICHHGALSEADADGLVDLRFAAVRPGPAAPERFERLLAAAEGYAAGVGIHRMASGLISTRHRAYASLLRRGARVAMFGVGLQRGPDGFAEMDPFLLDDWR